MIDFDRVYTTKEEQRQVLVDIQPWIKSTPPEDWPEEIQWLNILAVAGFKNDVARFIWMLHKQGEPTDGTVY